MQSKMSRSGKLGKPRKPGGSCSFRGPQNPGNPETGDESGRLAEQDSIAVGAAIDVGTDMDAGADAGAYADMDAGADAGAYADMDAGAGVEADADAADVDAAPALGVAAKPGGSGDRIDNNRKLRSKNGARSKRLIN